MKTSRSIRPFMARALRVLLVFALVFSMTLHWERSVAYGVGAPPVTVERAPEADFDKMLTDLLLYTATDSSDSWTLLNVDAPLVLDGEDAECYVVACPVWNGNYPEGFVTGEPLGRAPSAKFAQWSTTAGDAAGMGVNGDTNVLTLTVKSTGTTTVKCQVEAGGVTKEKKFNVNTTLPAPEEPPKEPDNPGGGDNPGGNPGDNTGDNTGGEGGEDPDNPENPDNPDDPAETEEPRLVSVEIFDEEGQKIAPGTPLSFEKSQIGETYQLQAVVTIDNLPLADQEGEDPKKVARQTYDSLKDGSLKEFSQGLLKDLSWTVTEVVAAPAEEGEEPASVVSVDEEGLLTVEGEGTCQVVCAAQVIATDQVMPNQVSVVVGSPEEPEEDPQGEAHPQDSLTVLSAVGGKEGANGEGGSQSGEGDGGDNGEEADPSTTPSEEELVNKTYSVDQLEVLGDDGTLPFTTRNFTMRAHGEPASITGRGFLLMDLLRDAYGSQEAVDEAPIESVDLIDYRGVATSLDWSFVQNASAMVAVESRVQTDQDSSPSPGTDQGPEGEGGSQEGDNAEGAGDGEGQSPDALLDNTRFRLLFNSDGGSYDADNLRYLNTIRLNMESKDSDDLAVSISYVPVPIGVEAEFVAIPTHNINGRWDCQWEQSIDGGKTWQTIEGANGQSLRVLTTQERLGTLYRVTIDNSTSLNSGEASEHLTGTSEPEELREGASLKLSYNPPKAGDMAIFRSSLYGYEGDVSALKYIWEYTEDGGASWNIVKNQNKPTLEVETKPVEETGGSGSGGGEATTPNLIYIRVRAIPPVGAPLVSNTVPLTVHVGGDEDTDPAGDNDDGRIDDPAGPQGTDTDNPTTPTQPAARPTAPGASAPPMIPINSIMAEAPTVDENTASAATPQAALNPEGTSSVPALPTDIYINEAVTEQVNAQNQAKEQVMESTTPGARWTKLKTLNPTGDDIQRVLADNPLVPFVLPTTLGFLFAGGLEKLIAFRRQL